jgi:hypothetical protein
MAPGTYGRFWNILRILLTYGGCCLVCCGVFCNKNSSVYAYTHKSQVLIFIIPMLMASRFKQKKEIFLMSWC